MLDPAGNRLPVIYPCRFSQEQGVPKTRSNVRLAFMRMSFKPCTQSNEAAAHLSGLILLGPSHLLKESLNQWRSQLGWAVQKALAQQQACARGLPSLQCNAVRHSAAPCASQDHAARDWTCVPALNMWASTLTVLRVGPNNRQP